MDSDLYPHRGFMLDTGRKFFPVQVILSLLTVLQQYNFNVFHWHIYDAETFPMYWPADGGLTNASLEHSYTHTYYTAQDIQSVVSHAQDLGILVYPETDMPAHCDIWGIWNKSLVVGTPNLKKPEAQLDIRQPQIFDYITSLVSTVDRDFGSPQYHHFGADEVSYMWQTKDDNKLFQSFLNRLKTLQPNNNKTLILWDDPLTDPEKHITLSKDWIIQTWHDGVTQSILNKGHPVIVSESAAFYIDNANYSITSSFVFPDDPNVLGFEVVWFTSEEDDPYDFNRSRVIEPLRAASQFRRNTTSSSSAAPSTSQQASKAILKSFVAACLLVFLSGLFAT